MAVNREEARAAALRQRVTLNRGPNTQGSEKGDALTPKVAKVEIAASLTLLAVTNTKFRPIRLRGPYCHCEAHEVQRSNLKKAPLCKKEGF